MRPPRRRGASATRWAGTAVPGSTAPDGQGPAPGSDGHAHRRHRSDRQRRDQPAHRVGRRSSRGLDRRRGAASSVVAATQGRVGRGRRRRRRSRPDRGRRGRRRPPVVADPAVARSAGDVGDERRRDPTRVVDAVARRDVPALVAASSVGAYSPAEPGRVVDESWPTDGTPESTYSWQKALEERVLDVARGTAAELSSGARPAGARSSSAARRGTCATCSSGTSCPCACCRWTPCARVVARLPLAFQVVHADDVAAANPPRARSPTLAVRSTWRHPACSAAPAAPGRPLVSLAGPLVGAAWRARLVPVDPGWLELAAAAPLMSTARATAELGLDTDARRRRRAPRAARRAPGRRGRARPHPWPSDACTTTPTTAPGARRRTAHPV